MIISNANQVTGKVLEIAGASSASDAKIIIRGKYNMRRNCQEYREVAEYRALYFSELMALLVEKI